MKKEKHFVCVVRMQSSWHWLFMGSFSQRRIFNGKQKYEEDPVIYFCDKNSWEITVQIEISTCAKIRNPEGEKRSWPEIWIAREQWEGWTLGGMGRARSPKVPVDLLRSLVFWFFFLSLDVIRRAMVNQ